MFSRLFRNRWAALLWAGGILWTAYDVAGTAPQPKPAAAVDATDTPVSGKDVAALAAASPN